jgi:hypothetical protein
VAFFHLKKLSSPVADNSIHWNYDRTEVIADAIIHALGVSFGLVGAVTLVRVSSTFTTVDTSVVAIYAVGLLTTLVLSAAYNLWPVSPRKWLLRRFDHSAIYLLIAATYTPFISQLDGDQISDGCVGRCNCGHSFKIKLSRSLRKDLDCVLFGYGVEPRAGLSQGGRLSSKLDLSTYRRRWWPLYIGRAIPFVAASAFSECNTAWLCDSRCRLPFRCSGRSCSA